MHASAGRTKYAYHCIKIYVNRFWFKGDSPRFALQDGKCFDGHDVTRGCHLISLHVIPGSSSQSRLESKKMPIPKLSSAIGKNRRSHEKD